MQKNIRFRKISLRAMGLLFLAACISIIAGSCRRNVVKYGGPPDTYRQINYDSTASIKDTVKK